MCNAALALTHMVDRMMTTYIADREEDFLANGGIKERMTAARLGRRGSQEAYIRQLEEENARLRAQLKEALDKLG